MMKATAAKVTSSKASITLIALLLQSINEAASFIINDDRVRSLDISPTLGRGYSVMTNTFQSTCMDVLETTVPSYNYDCKCQV